MRGNAQRMWTIQEYDSAYTKLEAELSEVKTLHRCRGDVIMGYSELLKETEEIKNRYLVGLKAIQTANASLATVQTCVEVATEALGT